MTISFQEKLKLESNDAIVLCRSSDEDGNKCFYYIRADKNNILKMHSDYQSGKEINFNSYGTIILLGWGENPSEIDEKVLEEIISNS